MSISDYWENKDLDALYGRTFSSFPATIYAQLHTGNPGEAGTANVHGTFSRVAIANDATHWPAAVAGVKQNGLKISWGSTAGVLSLPDATHVSLWDSATAGNCLDYGALDAALSVSDRAEVAILPGALSITRD